MQRVFPGDVATCGCAFAKTGLQVNAMSKNCNEVLMEDKGGATKRCSDWGEGTIHTRKRAYDEPFITGVLILKSGEEKISRGGPRSQGIEPQNCCVKLALLPRGSLQLPHPNISPPTSRGTMTLIFFQSMVTIRLG